MLANKWEVWPEAGQLCGSEPFKLFCRSGLPTSDQRVICDACGLEGGHSEKRFRSRTVSRCENHDHEQLQVITPPEQMWEQMGRPEWEAPYVWETNY